MTYLFIFAALAGAGAVNNLGTDSRQYRYTWQQSGLFDSALACHKAAANLGLDQKAYRCLLKSTGEVVG